MSIIYFLSDPTNADIKYVGHTIKKANERLNGHLSKARAGGKTHRDCWIRSLLERGLRPKIAFTFDVAVGEDWRLIEQAMINVARLMAWPICNHTDGGEGCQGYRHSPKMKAELSAIKKGKPILHLQNAEAVAKQAASRTGKKLTLEHCANIRKAHTGKVLSPEHRKKLSNVQKGRPARTPHHTAESKEKMRQAKLGKKLSPQHKEAAALAWRLARLAKQKGEAYEETSSIQTS